MICTSLLQTRKSFSVEENMDSIYSDLRIVHYDIKEINENWEMPWGEQRSVLNHCNEVIVYV